MRTSLGVVATIVAGVIAVAALRSPTAARPTQAIRRAARPATAMIVHRARTIEPRVEPSLRASAGARSDAERREETIEEGRFVAHVESIGKLVGRPASELVDYLGNAAKVGDDFIEWNVADVGIEAGNAYALATIEGGRVTGVLFRGRSSEDTLKRLKSRLSFQLTMAGGDRPSFSIVAGE